MYPVINTKKLGYVSRDAYLFYLSIPYNVDLLAELYNSFLLIELVNAGNFSTSSIDGKLYFRKVR
jgi:hypothetical protein